MNLIVAGAGNPLLVSTTRSAPAGRQMAFADRLMNANGRYLVANAACVAIGLLVAGTDVTRGRG